MKTKIKKMEAAAPMKPPGMSAYNKLSKDEQDRSLTYIDEAMSGGNQESMMTSTPERKPSSFFGLNLSLVWVLIPAIILLVLYGYL